MQINQYVCDSSEKKEVAVALCRKKGFTDGQITVEPYKTLVSFEVAGTKPNFDFDTLADEVDGWLVTARKA